MLLFDYQFTLPDLNMPATLKTTAAGHTATENCPGSLFPVVLLNIKCTYLRRMLDAAKI